MSNPFFYGGPIAGPGFADRQQELKDLLTLMREGRHGIVVSPRRYGKTSLLGRALQEARRQRSPRIRVGMVSLADVLDAEGARGIAEAVATEVLAGPLGGIEGKLEGMKRLVAGLRVRPVLTVGEDGRPKVSLEGGRGQAEWTDAIRDAILVLQQLKDEGSPVCLVIDEFQRVEEIEPGMAWIFKGMVDKLSGVSLIFSGSKRHLMLELADKPLKRVGTPMHLGKIDESVLVRHLRRLSEGAGKNMPAETGHAIFELMEGIPSDVQELAFWAFEEADGETVGAAALESGIARALNQRQDGYRDRINGIRSSVQGRIVLALARGRELNPYALDFTNRIRYANTTGIRKALDALESEELIERECSGAWRLSDPLMRQWLARRGTEVRP